jgi:hypothetical protein
MLQCCNQFIPLQTTETFVEPDEKYHVENILKKRMVSGKATILSNEKNTVPQKTRETQRKPTQLCKNTTTVEREVRVNKETKTH